MGFFFPSPVTDNSTPPDPGTRTNTPDTTSALATSVTLTDVNDTQVINHSTFLNMITVLEGMIDHTHTYTDDWTSNCNCNCTCQCSRGSL
jgi:hypothetical protein